MKILGDDKMPELAFRNMYVQYMYLVWTCYSVLFRFCSSLSS